MRPALQVAGATPILELDPDLGEAIDAAELDLARRVCVGTPIVVASGVWDTLPVWGAKVDVIGFLVTDGMLSRETSLRDRHMLELLGAGDVVLPPVAADAAVFASGTTVTAISDSMLVALETPFIRAAGRWPSLLGGIQRRTEAQRERLAVQGLIAHLPRADHRVLVLLWHLATRWGRVTPDGVVLPLHLTHDVIGAMVAARRPTVTLAVGALDAAGAIRRLDDGSWLLTPAGEAKLRAVVTMPTLPTLLGEVLALRQRSSDLRGDARAARAEARQTRGGH